MHGDDCWRYERIGPKGCVCVCGDGGEGPGAEMGKGCWAGGWHDCQKKVLAGAIFGQIEESIE